MADSDISRNLKRLLYERDMSVKQFSRASGINHASVYDYLNGRHEPNCPMLRRIRATLGCTWDELLGE